MIRAINHLKLLVLKRKIGKLNDRYQLYARAYLHCSQERMFRFSSAALECAVEHDTIADEIALLDPSSMIEHIIAGK